jgi:hypothetical protein
MLLRTMSPLLGFYPGELGGINWGHGEGLPGSTTTRRGAYLARPARGRTEASRGIEGVVEGKGTKSKGANQVEGEQSRYSDCGTR